MRKGGTRWADLPNRLRKARRSASWMGSWPGIWENATREGMEAPQSFSPTVLGILSLEPASSTGKSCAQSPPGYSWVFLGRAPEVTSCPVGEGIKQRLCLRPLLGSSREPKAAPIGLAHSYPAKSALPLLYPMPCVWVKKVK